MEVFLIRALQLILCFSILILLHEGGHFFFARLFGVRVEKFCLFFDPWKTLLKFKPKNSDTEYCLGWLPLGGYVKISGMIDESMDREQMKQPPQPWEFRPHPAWQRLLIMIGGVTVNLLLAFFIYAMVLFHWGESYVPMSNMTMGMKFSPEAQKLGFRDNDILLRTDTKTFKAFDSNDAITDTYRSISTAKYVVVKRAGKEVTVNLPAGNMNLLQMYRQRPPFVMAYMPSKIDSVVPNSIASKGGLKKNDTVVGLNGKKISTWNEYAMTIANLSERLKDAPTDDSLRLRKVQLVVVHAATPGKQDTLSMMLDENLLLGIVKSNIFDTYKSKEVDYGFFESFPAGVTHGVSVLSGYVNDLKYLFTKEGANSIGSFGAIGSMFPAHWSWYRFWELTAFISIILAFMNILPIPALDGGHVFFLLYEIIFRRKPSDKFMWRAEMVGIIILLGLMAFAIKNDIVNFLIK